MEEKFSINISEKNSIHFNVRAHTLYIVSTSHICGLVLLCICHCECETASQDENKEKGQSSRVSQNIRDKKVLSPPSLCSPDV